MANKKATRERAVVGRERMLALALRAVLDSLRDVKLEGEQEIAVGTAETDAKQLLNELGYSDLESIPVRVSRLNEQLKAAVESGDGKEIARLGLELDRAKIGLPPLKQKGEKARVAGGE